MLDINKIMNEFFETSSIGFPSYFGDIKTEEGKNEWGNWVRQSFKSKDGKTRIYSFHQKSSSEDNELIDLKMKLDNAVLKENFEEAVELRDKINSLKKNYDKISDLKKQLRESIDKQDFEKSIELRDKLKELKGQ